MSEFNDELQVLINKHSKENGSDTPDWILAEYLRHCLQAFDQSVIHREQFYGRMTAEATEGIEKQS